MYTVSPRERERYFLCTLLLDQKGSISYNELRTVNGVHHASFRDACASISILADDAEWRNALQESYASRFHPLTELSSIILVHKEPSNPLQLWSNHVSLFILDIRHRYLGKPSALSCLRSDKDAKIYTLIEFKDALDLIGSASLSDFGLLKPSDLPLLPQGNQTPHDRMELLRKEVNNAIPLFNAYQKFMFNEVTGAVLSGVTSNNINASVIEALLATSKAFFLDAPAGTGKNFVTRAIHAFLRLRSKNS